MRPAVLSKRKESLMRCHPDRRRLSPRLLLAALVAVFLLAPAAQASANPNADVIIEGSGDGRVFGVGSVAGIPDAIECHKPSEGGDVCEAEMAESMGLFVIGVKYEAAPGSEFVGWEHEGDISHSGCGMSLECRLLSSGADVTVKAKFEATGIPLEVEVEGEGEVTGPGIACPGDCSEAFTEGEEPELTATEESGWEFAGWTTVEGNAGSCESTTSPCEAGPLTEATKLKATFDPITKPLVIEVEGEGEVTGTGITCTETGNGSAECETESVEGSEPLLEAEAEGGWVFTGWETVEGNAGTCEGHTSPCEAGPLTEATKLKAVFSEPDVHVIIEGEGSGKVLGIEGPKGGNPRVDCYWNGSEYEEYESGRGLICDVEHGVAAGIEVINLVQEAAPGSVFAGWEVTEGTASGATCPELGTSCNVIFPPITVHATFDLIQFKELTVEVEGPGNVTGPGINCGSGGSECTEQSEEGGTVTLTAEEDEHAEFVEWAGPDAGVCAGESTPTCEVEMTADKAVKAVFAVTTHILTVAPTGQGEVNGGPISGCSESAGTCAGPVNEGDTVTLVATPASEWKVVPGSWTNCTEPSPTECEVTVNADTTVEVEFEESPDSSLSVFKGGNGDGTVTSLSPHEGINCGTEPCQATFEVGDEITLEASPEAGSVFAGWLGCHPVAGEITKCTVTLEGPLDDVTAVFMAEGEQGPQGEEGEQGPQGEEGPKGDPGAAGEDGAPGAPGAAGAQGPQGSAGADGAQGPRGDTGGTGPEGPQGAQGPRGKRGPAGKVKVICGVKGKKVRCVVKAQNKRGHGKRHHKRQRVGWRLMQGGHVVRHGRSSVRRLQRTLNQARPGRYVLRIAGQGGRRIHIG